MRAESFFLYRRLLRFLRPHLLPFLGSVLLMTGFAAMNGFSLAMIVPFTEIVLSGKGPEDLSAGTGAGAPSGGMSAGGIASSLRTLGGTMTGGARDTAAAAVAPSRAESLKEKGASLRRRAEAWFYSLLRGKDRAETLKRFCVALFLIFLVKNLLWYGQSYLVVKVEQSVIRDIRDTTYDHIQSLSLEYFTHTNSGNLISRMVSDIELVKGAIANGISDLIRQSLVLLAYLVTVLLASWQLFLFAVIILPPNLWLIDRIGRSIRRAGSVSQVKMARLTSVLSETLAAMRIIKAFGLEGRRRERFRTETRDYSSTMVHLTRVGSLATPLTEMLGVVTAVALLWYAGSRITQGTHGAGSFLLFLVGMLSMMQPIKVLSQVNVRIQQGLAGAQRIFEVLDSKPSVTERPGARPVASLEREIRLDKVGFCYRPGEFVLRGIDLVIRKGEVVALVGPSGGGKSTLIDLLPRFHDPVEGRVTIDGADLREVRVADLRALIGLVTQETILFEGTVAENIGLGRAGASDGEIRAAAAAANALEFVGRLPQGFDTPIGERGALLSGGQRQRLAIARAILRNPEVLVFDEATSSLDTESEMLVQEAIESLLRSRTAVVIAHRLSTVRRADRIVVLDGGRIVEEGTHAALLAGNGLYRRLYEMQFRDGPGATAPLSSTEKGTR